MVVAINKMDRQGADPEKIMFDLTSLGVNPELLGGDVPCITISATEKSNL